MFPAEIRIGYIFRYSYLWHRQYVQGRREGDKDRPCLVLAVVKIDENGRSIVRVLPITHSPPGNPDDAIEIPHAAKLRLGLDHDRSWIVLTETTGSSGRVPTCGHSIRRPAITDRCHLHFSNK